MNLLRLTSGALGTLAVAGLLGQVQTPAKADTASTAAIAAGAAAIVGTLLYDSSNRPYYVRNNHRYYVNQNVATYYRGHHRGPVRSAYVPAHRTVVRHAPNRGPENHNGGNHGGNHNGHDHH